MLSKKNILEVRGIYKTYYVLKNDAIYLLLAFGLKNKSNVENFTNNV